MVDSSIMVQVSSSEKLVDLVKRSGLVEDARVAEFLNGLTTELGRLPDSQEDLAEKMIQAGLITAWHAEKLLEGKHRGFVLGKYKLLDHLGKGGMSNVYLAEHTLMQRRVAIKVLPSDRVENQAY